MLTSSQILEGWTTVIIARWEDEPFLKVTVTQNKGTN